MTRILIVALLMPSPALAQWGPGGCSAFGPVGPPPVFIMPQQPVDARVKYTGVADGWHEGKDLAGGKCFYFYRGGKREAVFLPGQKAYRSLAVNGVWSAPRANSPSSVPAFDACKCCGDECQCANGKPCKKNACSCIVGEDVVAMMPRAEAAPACACGNETCKCAPGTDKCGPECLPTGVVKDEVGKHGRRFFHNGQEVSRDEAFQALAMRVYQGGELKDDSRKWRITCIGPKPDCDRAEKDMPADLRSVVAFQSYRPDNPLIDGEKYGFVTNGTPTIYVQAPPNMYSTKGGEVLCRLDKYEGPQTWQAIRAKIPDYDPSKDPKDGINLPMKSVPGMLWVVGVAAVVLLILNRRNQHAV